MGNLKLICSDVYHENSHLNFIIVVQMEIQGIYYWGKLGTTIITIEFDRDENKYSSCNFFELKKICQLTTELNLKVVLIQRAFYLVLTTIMFCT